MLDKLDDYAHRPMRYKYIDGIWEMGIGFLFLAIPLLGKSLKDAPRNSVWHWRGTAVLSFALLGFVVFGGARALKKRITYPRTGFVKYRGLAGKPWVTGMIAGALSIPATILYAFLWRRFKFSVPVALDSAAWGLMYAFVTGMDGAWRWVLLAVMVVGPVVISMLPVGREWLDAPWVGFLGLTYFVSGMIALSLYLRRTRPPDPEAE
jgi:hypothetical protein